MKPEMTLDITVQDLYSGLDWLTCTASDTEKRAAMLTKFIQLKEALRLLGEIPKDWGFRGYKGLQIGSVRWGQRKSSSIIILSGNDALAFWRVIAPLADNCSRVDLAVTARTDKWVPFLIDQYIDWIREYGTSGQRRMVEVRPEDRPGGCLYIGSRFSDQFGRLYDKGAEMGIEEDTGRLWRYEVEYKDYRASKVLEKLMNKRMPFFPECILATVWHWFDERQIPPVFSKRDLPPMAVDLQATVTTVSQKLNWLSKQVRPTVGALVAEGYNTEVLLALGLDDLDRGVDKN
jgi:DNA relaxase NicK